MQASLKSFQTAGSGSNVQSGLDIIDTLLKATMSDIQEIKLYFINKNLTGMEIIDIAASMVYTELQNLIIKSETLNDEAEDAEEAKWKDDYLLINNIDINQYHSIFLRVSLDIYKIYKNKITLYDIIKEIKKNITVTDDVLLIPSPLSLGYIDIYVSAQKKFEYTDTTEEIQIDMFLTTEFENYQKIYISGIKGIEDYYIVQNSVLSIIKSEKINNNDTSTIMLDSFLMYINDISKERLLNLLNVAGIIVIPDEFGAIADNNKITTKTVISSQPVKQILAKAGLATYEYYIDIDEEIYIADQWEVTFNHLIDSTYIDKFNEFIQEFKLNIKIISFDDNKIFVITTVENITPSNYINNLFNTEYNKIIDLSINDNYHPIIFAKDQCYAILFREKYSDIKKYLIQLDEVFDFDFVDTNRSYSNNIEEMVTVFGIEAGRKIFLKILSEFIYGTGTDLNPSYVTFVADYATFSGKYTGANVSHMISMGMGMISALGVDHAYTSLQQAGAGKFGSSDSVGNAVITSADIKIGTYYGLGKYDMSTISAKEQEIIQQKLLDKAIANENRENEREDFFDNILNNKDDVDELFS